MTVENQTTKVTANGNDSATTFSFSPMVIFGAGNLSVVTTDADGVETTRTQGTGATNWSISITTFPATGSITYPADEVTPLPTGQTITIKRVLTLEQQTVLNNQGGYLPKNQEKQFDKQVMIDLQQQEEIDRSFRLPLSYAGGASIEWPVPVASKVIAWNSGATAVEYLTTNSSSYITLPASVTDNTLVRFDGTTGTALKENATTITVAEGGTGAATLTDGGVLLGSGTGAITPMAVLADGEFIVGDGTTDPVAESGATARTSMGVAIGADVQAYDADNAVTDAIQVYTKPQRPTVTALTSTAASIAIELNDSNDFSHTFTENTQLANPTSVAVAGQKGTIYFTQHASSPKTLAFGSEYDFVGGTAFTVTATNAAKDSIDYAVRADGIIELSGFANWS